MNVSWERLSHTGSPSYILKQHGDFGVEYHLGVLKQRRTKKNRASKHWEVLTYIDGVLTQIAALDLPLTQAKPAAKLILMTRGD
jgi:hypothetical protein